MLLFIQYGSKPWIHLVSTATPDLWLNTVIGTARGVEQVPHCVARCREDPDLMADFLTRFGPERHPAAGGYPDTPRLREWLAAAPKTRAGASGAGRPVTFGDDTAVEIWRAAWAGEDTDVAIARRYGVSQMLVSALARGDTRKHLFATRIDDGWVYIRLAQGDAGDGTEYRFRNGGRRK